ncbi:POPLD-domain-containing protein [Lepidopterella palustris CBS 459.81]|uniref:POPLD-domain-containing protein n=1 Tax=Lepidopterella palustris CBS 459.81 TaxID=1314670 RepID=A0A8E2EK71_9PEZI|nr:POPLD-domain-containing protein [Lepidopterella palustris CBS 459.81]
MSGPRAKGSTTDSYAPKKRKDPPSSSSNNASKRHRPQFPSKTIPATSTSKAFPNDEISVSRFVQAREREVLALEGAMQAAKRGQMRRAFQDVPRDMRRRTASHNPRRVPGRLRSRMGREMREDNTTKLRGKSGSGVGKGSRMWIRKDGVMKKVQKRKEKGEKGREKGKKRKGEDCNRNSVGAKDTTKSDLTKDEKDALAQRIQNRKPRVKHSTSLATPPTPPARFRKRQINKSWLPTHMFHTKRAHMTPPSQPLWRFALPLTPTAKSYRPTHRANTLRGAIAWDMSYIATIGLEGVEGSITGLLKSLGVGDGVDEEIWEDRGKGKKWRDGVRVWDGWIFDLDAWPEGIAPATVIWCTQEKNGTMSSEQPPGTSKNKREKRRVFIRTHPAGFPHLWGKASKLAKVQKPAVSIEDLRFEIGSIVVSGPGATEALNSALWPSPSLEGQEHSPDSPETVWKTLASLTNPGSLPLNALLGFNISDPRLHHPPRTVAVQYDTTSQSQLTRTLAFWPIDKTQSPPAIFDRNVRLASSRSLPSQQSINRRKRAAIPGDYPEPRSTDPQIPVLLYASREAGSWTLLLPWKCVLPVWRALMYYPLSTGGNPKFGGLKEVRQLAFEDSRPWFPGDYPGTRAGWAWELQERLAREKEWAKRPPGKRINWESVDLGNGRKGELGRGWACDWENIAPQDEGQDPQDSTIDPQFSPFQHLPSRIASEFFSPRGFHDPKGVAQVFNIDSYLFTVKLTLLARGVPTPCARIYRLPTTNPDLRARWLSLIPSSESLSQSKNKSSKPLPRLPKNAPSHLRRRALAASLLEPVVLPKVIPQPGHKDYPFVPDKVDLIGFVTTGNFNLGEGKGTAVANLVVAKVFEQERGDGKGKMQEKFLCIVREAGQSVGRLARWEAT